MSEPSEQSWMKRIVWANRRHSAYSLPWSERLNTLATMWVEGEYATQEALRILNDDRTGLITNGVNRAIEDSKSDSRINLSVEMQQSSEILAEYALLEQALIKGAQAQGQHARWEILKSELKQARHDIPRDPL